MKRVVDFGVFIFAAIVTGFAVSGLARGLINYSLIAQTLGLFFIVYFLWRVVEEVRKDG